MPTYQYACTECGKDLEAVQKFTDDPLTVCPVCGGKLRKLFSAVGIVFKGSGFYRTDSRNGSDKAGSKEKKADSPAGSNGSSGSKDKTDAGSSGGDSKPAKKAEPVGSSGKSGGSGGSGASPSGSKVA